MLVVVVIIAILIGMLGSSYIEARNHAKRARAEAQLRELVKAWNEYYLAYSNTWPTVLHLPVDGSSLTVAMLQDSTIQPLFATDTTGNNTKAIPFLSISPAAFHTYSSGESCYTDPWWTPADVYPLHAYKITFGSGAAVQETALRIAVSFPNRDRYR